MRGILLLLLRRFSFLGIELAVTSIREHVSRAIVSLSDAWTAIIAHAYRAVTLSA